MTSPIISEMMILSPILNGRLRMIISQDTIPVTGACKDHPSIIPKKATDTPKSAIEPEKVIKAKTRMRPHQI